MHQQDAEKWQAFIGLIARRNGTIEAHIRRQQSYEQQNLLEVPPAQAWKEVAREALDSVQHK